MLHLLGCALIQGSNVRIDRILTGQTRRGLYNKVEALWEIRVETDFQPLCLIGMKMVPI